jgi:hypothetical protein
MLSITYEKYGKALPNGIRFAAIGNDRGASER